MHIIDPDGEERALRVPAGSLCSSFRAEMVALQAALALLAEHPTHTEDPIVVCTDSQSALAVLRDGPSAQSTPLGCQIWEALSTLTAGGRPVHLQWVPSHCELPGNDRADGLAKEATALPQEDVPVDVRTVYRAAARATRAHWVREWPRRWYRRLMGDSLPPPVMGMDRQVAVDVHQLRAGHWSGSRQYLHRIGRGPTGRCAGCEDVDCEGALCPTCREAADTPQHVLLDCPALMGARLRSTGTIRPYLEEMRSSRVVAALGAAARSLQSRQATTDRRSGGN